MNHGEDSDSSSADNNHGFEDLIIRERAQYCKLIDIIEKSVESVIDVLMGRRIGDKTNQMTFESIQSNKTPQEWLRHCFPSFTTLSMFLDNLLERINYIESLIQWFSIEPD